MSRTTSGECEIEMASWEAAINELLQLYMKAWEATIAELYQLYCVCKKTESHVGSKIIQQSKQRNVRFKIIVGNGTTSLHLMCFHGNLGMVKLLVEMYGNSEAKDENQRTPLHLACQQGHLEIAQYLHYEQGCNLQYEDKEGWTPCELAHFHNHKQIVKYFNACGQFPYADLMQLFQGISRLYRLFTACKKRKFHLIRESNSQLCGMNVNFVLKEENCFTTLHLMCELGVLDRVKSLIEMYGNVEARDEEGQTPLHIACANGHIDAVEYLIKECGCNKEARDNEQKTPLFTACFQGQTGMVKYLVSRFGCKFDVRNYMGWSPLHTACGRNCIHIAEYLISQCGCDKEAKDNERQFTPLFCACAGGHTDIVKCLISKFGCKVDVRDNEERTPLHFACLRGCLEVVQYLISECGCSPEVTEKTYQQTPLHYACDGGNLEIIKYLVSECKCNAEARDKFNRTPLYLVSHPSHSVSHINTEIVSYLISQGCDPEAEALDGKSPIRFFYTYGKLDLIKYCIKHKKHDPKTWKSRLSYSQILNQNNNERQNSLDHAHSNVFIVTSPLHVACSPIGSMDVVRFLVEGYGLDPLERGQVSGSDNTKKLSYWKKDGLPFTKNITRTPPDILNQATPLLTACLYGRLDMLQYLISKCGPAAACHGTELMLMASGYGHSEIVKYLLNLEYSTPYAEDSRGNIPIHHATRACLENLKGAYETIKILIATMSNIDQKNNLGETALHTACKIQPCCPDIIELLLFSGCSSQVSNYAGNTPLRVTKSPEVFKVFMQYSPADVCERILLDDIDEEQSLEMLQCLINEHNWNPNSSTKNGDTVLHLACKADRLIIVKYLFSIDAFRYDSYAKNKLNQTPIELTSSKEIIRELIKQGSNPIDLLINPIMDEVQVLHLVMEIDEDKLNAITVNDNTALHLACLTDRATIVRYLLKESKIDVNAKNESDISPIQLTKNSEIIIELIRHGANPTDLYSYCRRVLGESKLHQTTVKVFVLGDSNAGKSTLISSLKKEGWFNFFTNWSSRTSTAADNAESGHGIITHDFDSKHCGQITLYDFVGRRLFHESQSDLLRQTAHSPRVFLVVTDLSSSDEDTVSNLQYWLGFLEEVTSSDSEFRNHTIIVGSHVDKCGKDETRKASIIKNFLQERVDDMSNVDYHDFTALDCRSHSLVTKLRRCLAKLCVIARNPKSLAFNAHCFQVYIVDRFREKVVISLHEILIKLKGEEEDVVDENDPLNFLPQTSYQLHNLCCELHNKSQILYLRDSQVNEMDFKNSWIIIDKAALISQIFEAFESMTFKALPSNNGILTISIISDLRLFKVNNFDMLIRFLCHFEYCKEISDQKTVQTITNSAHLRLTERCFFFPALIENSAPEEIWDGDSDDFIYHCGWILQCIKSEQFFTSNFLHTLILRVMFSNTYLGPSGASIPALLKCSLWKGGIFWGNIFGAESLVEVLPNNKAIMFLMRCRDANLAKCMEHRSTVIHQIRKCAKEFCGNLKTRESLILPTLVTKYPVHTTHSDLFDIQPLAFSLAMSIEDPYASSLTGTNTISIRQLLKFEPYIELSALIIQEICNSNNPRYISCLTDDFLLHFTQCVRKNSLFIKVITQILNDYQVVDSSAENLLNKLVEWRDTCDITYQQLHKCIDRFSFFAGINIVVCLLYN